MDQVDSYNDPNKQPVQQQTKTKEPEPPVEIRTNTAAETEAPETVDKEPKVIAQQGGHKTYVKRLAIILLVLVVISTGVWWFVMRGSKSNTSSKSSNYGSQTQTTQTVNNYTPATVAYAFKGDSTPYIIYWRPANGGDRTPVDQKLDTSETIVDSDVNGSNVVVASSKAIYVSTDSGKSYKAVVKLKANEQVTSVKFATDGKSIVYGDLPDAGGKNTVKSMDLDGTGSKTVFTSNKAGVFIIGYNSAKQKIVYREGCYNCDGGADLPILRDIKANKTSNLMTGLTINEVADIAISSDFSSLVFAQSTENASAPEQALGVFTGAPYAINTVDLRSLKTTKVTGFGTKGEKNTNGTLKARQVHVGFVAGTNSIYYTDDTKLYVVSAGKTSLVYEASKPLLFVPYVGKDVVIAGSGDQTADYTLTNYNISIKKSTTILSGDNNTILFGVTMR